MILEYDGTEFHGWQRQRGERTVQQEIEDALAELNRGVPVTVIGAGRTDAGVHALGQVAHFDLETRLTPTILRQALNAKTGADIQIRECLPVQPDFHARFDARCRYYRYRICRRRAVLERRTSWQIERDFDVATLRECALLIRGEHDFSRLSRVSRLGESKICRIYDSQWIKSENFLNYTIAGNRFLHSMVRILVGTMLMIAQGKGSVRDFQHLIANRPSSLQIYNAPPQGLTLMRVEYEEYDAANDDNSVNS